MEISNGIQDHRNLLAEGTSVCNSGETYMPAGLSQPRLSLLVQVFGHG